MAPESRDQFERLVTHAEVIATASVRIELELREKVTRLRQQMILIRIIGVVVALAIVLIGATYATSKSRDQHAAQLQRQQLRDTMCGGFVPLSSQPINPQTTDLGKSLIFWAKAGVAQLDCPR